MNTRLQCTFHGYLQDIFVLRRLSSFTSKLEVYKRVVNHQFTLNMPAMLRVRLEVYVTTRNSLISIAKAMVAPTDTFSSVGPSCSVGRLDRYVKHSLPERSRRPLLFSFLYWDLGVGNFCSALTYPGCVRTYTLFSFMFLSYGSPE